MLRFTDNIIGQMTRDCNLRCKYCYEAPGTDPAFKGKYIDFETFKYVLDTVLYNRCVLGAIENQVNWHFHGGEVLLLPQEDLVKSIQYVEERQKFFPGLMWCTQSNGVLLNEELAKFFVQHNASFGFSFDGFDIEDRMSKQKNRELIDKLRGFHNKLGLHTSFIMVLKKKNMKTWFQDAQSCMDFSDHVGINILCAMTDDDIPTMEEQWTYWFEPTLNSLLTDHPVTERDTMFMCSYAIQSLVYGIKRVPKTGCFNKLCAFGSNMISIDPNLNMHGCDKHLEYGPYIDLIEYKPLDSLDFLGYQTARTVMDHLTKMAKIEKEFGCDTCRAKEICPGECQAYNISRYGQVQLNQEFCKLYTRIFDFIEEHWTEILQHTFVTCLEEPTELTAYARARLQKEHLKIHFEQDRIFITKENQ